jgi:hypothetical protein
MASFGHGTLMCGIGAGSYLVYRGFIAVVPGQGLPGHIGPTICEAWGCSSASASRPRLTQGRGSGARTHFYPPNPEIARPTRRRKPMDSLQVAGWCILLLVIALAAQDDDEGPRPRRRT